MDSLKENQSLLTNEELLFRYQQADALAFDTFFNRNQKLIFNYLFSKLGNRFETEEAFQKTFLRVHRYILSYDPRQSALGWVFTVARNVALELKMKRGEDCQDLELAGTSIEIEPMLEARSVLLDLLSKLSVKERQLLEQRFIQDQTCEEIAAQEGWSGVKARQKFSRLLRKLRLRADFS